LAGFDDFTGLLLCPASALGVVLAAELPDSVPEATAAFLSLLDFSRLVFSPLASPLSFVLPSFEAEAPFEP
jgi:hypothetical protein